MKSQFKGFISGILTTVLVGTIAVSALAASGRMTIEVDPINIQVNGETFAPKDANENPVPVFAYNGTTMAPLRALAEAYGLEVGYDATANMATVTNPSKPQNTPAPDTTAKTDYSDWSAEDEAAYQEFKGMWEIEKVEDMGMFANPVTWSGCEINPMETDLYYLSTFNKLLNEAPGKELRNAVYSYYKENMLTVMQEYADRLSQEFFMPQRNTYIIFMLNGCEVCRHMRLADGDTTVEWTIEPAS